MRRRDFITLLSGAAAAPCAASAQQKLKVVGCLFGGAPWPGFSPLPDPSREGPMRKELRETGYIDRAERFDQPLGDLFAMQKEVASRWRLELHGRDRNRHVRRGRDAVAGSWAVREYLTAQQPDLFTGGVQ